MIKINKIDGIATVICDSCGYEEIYNESDFMALIELIKDDGWRNVTDGYGGWENLCPDCA